MKVAFVYPHWNLVFPPDGISDALAVLGYEITRRLASSCDVVIYPRRKLGQKQMEKYEGVTCRRVPVGIDRVLSSLKILDRLALRDPRRPFHASALYYPGYSLRVAKDLKRQQFDIAHIFTVPQIAPIIRRFNPGIKIVLHMQDHSLTQRDHLITRRRLDSVDLIIGCSEYVTRNIQKEFPSFAERCRTVYNGVDVDRFRRHDTQKVSPEDGVKTLLFVGRISPEKGIHVMLDAFQKVIANHPQTHLEIVGPKTIAPRQFVDPLDEDEELVALKPFYTKPKSYFSYLQEKLPARVAEKVFFLEAVPNRNLVEYYQRADIFIFPSVWHEPFGIPTIEAMASVIPTIATRSGALPEIVEHGKTGLLVTRGDTIELAESIKYLLLRSDLRASMGSAGRRRALEVFSWDRTVSRLLNLYERILNKDRS